MSEARTPSFTFLAVADLRAICDAIALPTDMWGVTAAPNLARAREFADTFARHCELLAAHADMGADRGELLHGLRSSPFQRYTIFYRTRGDMVEVVRVLRGASDAILG
jgi:toxin ParE1/3/4